MNINKLQTFRNKIQDFKSSKVIFNIATALIITIMTTDLALAATPDAFSTIHSKIQSWVNGSLGKLITFCAFIVTAIMGVAGYPIKAILGVAMLGLTLASADALVGMLF